MEAKCYRFLSHTTDDDDRTYRTREEVDAQPRARSGAAFRKTLDRRRILTDDSLAALRREITETVNATTDAVEAEALPVASDLYGNVYAESDDAWI